MEYLGYITFLQDPYLGAMSTPFAREIAVDEYNPKSDITYSDGTGVNGGDYGRNDRKGGKFHFHV